MLSESDSQILSVVSEINELDNMINLDYAITIGSAALSAYGSMKYGVSDPIVAGSAFVATMSGFMVGFIACARAATERRLESLYSRIDRI